MAVLALVILISAGCSKQYVGIQKKDIIDVDPSYDAQMVVAQLSDGKTSEEDFENLLNNIKRENFDFNAFWNIIRKKDNLIVDGLWIDDLFQFAPRCNSEDNIITEVQTASYFLDYLIKQSLVLDEGDGYDEKITRNFSLIKKLLINCEAMIDNKKSPLVIYSQKQLNTLIADIFYEEKAWISSNKSEKNVFIVFSSLFKLMAMDQDKIETTELGTEFLLKDIFNALPWDEHITSLSALSQNEDSIILPMLENELPEVFFHTQYNESRENLLKDQKLNNILFIDNEVNFSMISYSPDVTTENIVFDFINKSIEKNSVKNSFQLYNTYFEVFSKTQPYKLYKSSLKMLAKYTMTLPNKESMYILKNMSMINLKSNGICREFRNELSVEYYSTVSKILNSIVDKSETLSFTQVFSGILKTQIECGVGSLISNFPLNDMISKYVSRENREQSLDIIMENFVEGLDSVLLKKEHRQDILNGIFANKLNPTKIIKDLKTFCMSDSNNECRLFGSTNDEVDQFEDLLTSSIVKTIDTTNIENFLENLPSLFVVIGSNILENLMIKLSNSKLDIDILDQILSKSIRQVSSMDNNSLRRLLSLVFSKKKLPKATAELGRLFKDRGAWLSEHAKALILNPSLFKIFRKNYYYEQASRVIKEKNIDFVDYAQALGMIINNVNGLVDFLSKLKVRELSIVFNYALKSNSNLFNYRTQKYFNDTIVKKLQYDWIPLKKKIITFNTIELIKNEAQCDHKISIRRVILVFKGNTEANLVKQLEEREDKIIKNVDCSSSSRGEHQVGIDISPLTSRVELSIARDIRVHTLDSFANVVSVTNKKSTYIPQIVEAIINTDGDLFVCDESQLSIQSGSFYNMVGCYKKNFIKIATYLNTYYDLRNSSQVGSNPKYKIDDTGKIKLLNGASRYFDVIHVSRDNHSTTSFENIKDESLQPRVIME